MPTPDSEEWDDPEQRYRNDTTFFKDMVEYMDKIVGKIVKKTDELKISENTIIIIFTSDNGTHPSIYTNTVDGIIKGGKANITDAGTHIPLIVSWPGRKKRNSI